LFIENHSQSTALLDSGAVVSRGQISEREKESMKKVIKWSVFIACVLGVAAWYGYRAGNYTDSKSQPTTTAKSNEMQTASIVETPQPEQVAPAAVAESVSSVAAIEANAPTNKVERITFRIRPKLGRGTNAVPIQASVN
jgi:hypothetical protein